MDRTKIQRKKVNENFMLHNYQIDLLVLVKSQTGINKSEQVRLALDDFFRKLNIDVESYQL